MNKFVFIIEVYSTDMDHMREIELVADWTYSPFCPGSREQGQLMEPDEPESYEIDGIRSNSTVPDPLEIAVVEYFEDSFGKSEAESLIKSIKSERLSNAG